MKIRFTKINPTGFYKVDFEGNTFSVSKLEKEEVQSELSVEKNNKLDESNQSKHFYSKSEPEVSSVLDELLQTLPTCLRPNALLFRVDVDKSRLNPTCSVSRTSTNFFCLDQSLSKLFQAKLQKTTERQCSTNVYPYKPLKSCFFDAVFYSNWLISKRQILFAVNKTGAFNSELLKKHLASTGFCFSDSVFDKSVKLLNKIRFCRNLKVLQKLFPRSEQEASPHRKLVDKFAETLVLEKKYRQLRTTFCEAQESKELVEKILLDLRLNSFEVASVVFRFLKATQCLKLLRIRKRAAKFFFKKLKKFFALGLHFSMRVDEFLFRKENEDVPEIAIRLMHFLLHELVLPFVKTNLFLTRCKTTKFLPYFFFRKSWELAEMVQLDRLRDEGLLSKQISVNAKKAADLRKRLASTGLAYGQLKLQLKTPTCLQAVCDYKCFRRSKLLPKGVSVNKALADLHAVLKYEWNNRKKEGAFVYMNKRADFVDALSVDSHLFKTDFKNFYSSVNLALLTEVLREALTEEFYVVEHFDVHNVKASKGKTTLSSETLDDTNFCKKSKLVPREVSLMNGKPSEKRFCCISKFVKTSRIAFGVKNNCSASFVRQSQSGPSTNLWLRVRPPTVVARSELLAVVHSFLYNNVMQHKKGFFKWQALPHGACVSPLLARFYLAHVLDRFVRFDVEHCLGPNCVRLFSYFDDVLVLSNDFVGKRFVHSLLHRLPVRFGLRINSAKTEIAATPFSYCGFRLGSGTVSLDLTSLRRVPAKHKVFDPYCFASLFWRKNRIDFSVVNEKLVEFNKRLLRFFPLRSCLSAASKPVLLQQVADVFEEVFERLFVTVKTLGFAKYLDLHFVCEETVRHFLWFYKFKRKDIACDIKRKMKKVFYKELKKKLG